MRTAILLAAASVVFAGSLALAQVGQIASGPLLGGGAVYYQGPGDVIAVPAGGGWWGFRAYNHAYAVAHSQIATIQRISDNTTCTVVSDNNGNLDLVGTPCSGATIVSFCNLTTCEVNKLFDQTGHGFDLTQATAANKPVLTFTCINTTLPCMGFTGSSSQVVFTTAGTASAAPVSLSAVAKRTGSFTAAQMTVSGNDASNVTAQTGFYAATNQWYLAAGGSAHNTVTLSCGAACLDSAWHAFQGLISGVSNTSAINIDGTDLTGLVAGTNGISARFALGGNTTQFLTGQMVEGGIWAGTAFNATNRNAICHNHIAYWGVSGATC